MGGQAMSGIMCAVLGSGQQSQTVIVTSGYNSFYTGGGSLFHETFGYSSYISIGSLSYPTFTFTETPFLQLDYGTINGGSGTLYFAVNGSCAQNVFTRMTIGSNVYTTNSASFYGGTYSEWVWNSVSTNPFPTLGGQYSVNFS